MTPQDYGDWTGIPNSFKLTFSRWGSGYYGDPRKWIRGHQLIPHAWHYENGYQIGVVRNDIKSDPPTEDYGPYDTFSGFPK